MKTDSPRVAIIHDWLTGMRGGERVLEAMVELFPRAEIFTLIAVPGSVSPILTVPRKHTSWLQKIPQIEKRYRHFLPFMPHAISQFDLSGFDLILSSSHCVAKGIQKPPGALHISYVHAPMRYFWDRFPDYFGPGRASPWVRWAARTLRKPFQKWDRRVSAPERVDSFIANSQYIAGQIQEFYSRPAQVIYPFVDLQRFQLSAHPEKRGRAYLMVGAFAPYKRMDLAIEAFNQLGLSLLIVGAGQEAAALKKKAKPNVEFLGKLSNPAILDLYQKCRAFVFPGKEDFGIAPLEALACGTPVIAYGAGGALETVTNETGVFFQEQAVESLIEAVLKVESGSAKFDPRACRAQAEKFTRERFQSEFRAAVERELARHSAKTAT